MTTSSDNVWTVKVQFTPGDTKNRERAAAIMAVALAAIRKLPNVVQVTYETDNEPTN